MKGNYSKKVTPRKRLAQATRAGGAFCPTQLRWLGTHTGQLPYAWWGGKMIKVTPQAPRASKRAGGWGRVGGWVGGLGWGGVKWGGVQALSSTARKRDLGKWPGTTHAVPLK